MKLAVSNIAWAPGDRDRAYALLREKGIRGLEIAPGLFLNGAGDVFDPDDQEMRMAMRAVEGAGLELVSMQSLLFGVTGAELFGLSDARARFVAGMERAIRLAGRLGVPNLVFGSPRQRVIPDGMGAAAAVHIAVETFTALADLARAEGTCIAMEVNPVAYGTNFLTELEPAHEFVVQMAHPAIRLCFDIGAMHMNAVFDRVPDRISAMLPIIGHVHISEPRLAPAPAREAHARTVCAALTQGGYGKWVSIEMGRVEGDPHLRALSDGIDRLKAACS